MIRDRVSRVSVETDPCTYVFVFDANANAHLKYGSCYGLIKYTVAVACHVCCRQYILVRSRCPVKHATSVSDFESKVPVRPLIARSTVHIFEVVSGTECRDLEEVTSSWQSLIIVCEIYISPVFFMLLNMYTGQVHAHLKRWSRAVAKPNPFEQVRAAAAPGTFILNIKKPVRDDHAKRSRHTAL